MKITETALVIPPTFISINTLRLRQNVQTTFSRRHFKCFSWIKMYEFRLRFHWSLFLRIQLNIFQHRFRWWLGADQATSHYLNQWWLFYWRIYASLGLNELNFRAIIQTKSQSLTTNSPAPWPVASPASASGTRSYETTSRDQRGKIEMFFSSTGACTAAKFPIANHHSQINTQLYSASLTRRIWQQCHSDSEFDVL